MKKEEYTIYTDKIMKDKNIIILSNFNCGIKSKNNVLRLLNKLNEINISHVIINECSNNDTLSLLNSRYNVVNITNNSLLKNSLTNDINFHIINFNERFHTLDERDKLLELIVEYKDKIINLSNKLDRSKFNILLTTNPLILDAIKIYNNIYECDIDLDLIISSINKYSKYKKGIISYDINKYMICESMEKEKNILNSFSNGKMSVLRLLKK